jgi:hypothetical protein
MHNIQEKLGGAGGSSVAVHIHASRLVSNAQRSSVMYLTDSCQYYSVCTCRPCKWKRKHELHVAALEKLIVAQLFKRNHAEIGDLKSSVCDLYSGGT